MLDKEISNSDPEELFVKGNTRKEELDIYCMLYQEKATVDAQSRAKIKY